MKTFVALSLATLSATVAIAQTAPAPSAQPSIFDKAVNQPGTAAAEEQDRAKLP